MRFTKGGVRTVNPALQESDFHPLKPIRAYYTFGPQRPESGRCDEVDLEKILVHKVSSVAGVEALVIEYAMEECYRRRKRVSGTGTPVIAKVTAFVIMKKLRPTLIAKIRQQARSMMDRFVHVPFCFYGIAQRKGRSLRDLVRDELKERT